MKSRWLIWCGCLVWLLCSCDRLTYDGHRIQRAVIAQEEYAEQKSSDVIRALSDNDINALHRLSEREDNVMFFIHKGESVFYWSDAWLNAVDLPLKAEEGRWLFQQWNNACGLVRKEKYDEYEVLTLIPIKYDYAITSEQLRNNFIKPFRGEEQWTLVPKYSGDRRNYYPIYSSDGMFLFSLCGIPGVNSHTLLSKPSRSFSYQSIFTSEDRDDDNSHFKLRIYYSLTIVLFVLLATVALYWLIRCRGFRSMKLGGKFQLILISLLTMVFVSIFILSVVYIRRMFVVRQEHNLEKKAQYVQSALQNLYFWDIELGPQNTQALNVDLRDMCYAYETDIHIYDLDGVLVGSSSPELFEQGILSPYISPKPFFGTSTCVQYEHIGDVRYLTAYTEFYNGNYSQIGYIALPYFISQDQVDANVENYVVRLLPLYLILLVLAIAVIWIIAHILSKSLGAISNQMQKYKLGGRGTHIDYFFHDELGDLVQHYNEMTDALAESTECLARTEREQAWRTMARQVAHEINNNLTPIKLTLQQMRRLRGTDRFDEYFDRSSQLLIEQANALGHIASSFSSFAKMPEVNPAEVDVAQKLYASITLLRESTARIPIRYIGPEQGVWAMADGEQITQVFTNIVRNAVQAMTGEKGGDIIIILKELPGEQQETRGLDGNSKWIEISFSDNGPGIPVEIRDKVFMPNFTTKNTGMGLGLAISKNIVEGGGGKICFQTSEKGTTFFVHLRKKA